MDGRLDFFVRQCTVVERRAFEFAVEVGVRGIVIGRSHEQRAVRHGRRLGAQCAVCDRGGRGTEGRVTDVKLPRTGVEAQPDDLPTTFFQGLPCLRALERTAVAHRTQHAPIFTDHQAETAIACVVRACNQALSAAVEESREYAAAKCKTITGWPRFEVVHDGVGPARHLERPGLGQLGNPRFDFLHSNPQTSWICIRGDYANNIC
jgi:hypothetical protein